MPSVDPQIDRHPVTPVPAAGEVEYAVLGGTVALITLNRPPVNALSADMYRQLGEAIGRVRQDDSLRAVVFTGAGRLLTAGADIKELNSPARETREEFQKVSAATRQAFRSIPIPVIAAINGPAVGAGVIYSAYADYRIADPDAFVSLPEINVGNVAGGGEYLMALGVPIGSIRYMLYTGRRIPAEEALSLHMIDEIAPKGRALETALDRARAMAEKPRDALIGMKAAINAAAMAAQISAQPLPRTEGTP
jgi:enoyl-CoA hydratase/carnithine racemase